MAAGLYPDDHRETLFPPLKGPAGTPPIPEDLRVSPQARALFELSGPDWAEP
jgi:hypothetical protein